MIRPVGEPNQGQDQQLVDHFSQWIANRQVWGNDNADLARVRSPYSPAHYRADWRFEWSEPIEVLLATVEQDMQTYCEWGYVGYHECYHDADNPAPCSMEYGQQQGEYGAVWGDIPADLDPR